MTGPRYFHYIGEKTSAEIAALPVEYVRAGNLGFDTDLTQPVYCDGSAWIPYGGA